MITGAHVDDEGESADEVVLRIPNEPRFVRIARLAVGGVASLLDLDVEVIEDLRIAVNELCAATLEMGDGPIDVTITTEPGRIRIEATSLLGVAPLDAERFALSKQILAVIADDFGVTTSGGRVRSWIERSTAEWSQDSGQS